MGEHLFSACSVAALGLHCSRPVMKSADSPILRFPRVFITRFSCICILRCSNRREKALRAVGVHICLWKYVHGREESCQHSGFVSSSQCCWPGLALLLQCHCLDQTSFPCKPLLRSLYILNPLQEERQGFTGRSLSCSSKCLHLVR